MAGKLRPPAGYAAYQRAASAVLCVNAFILTGIAPTFAEGYGGQAGQAVVNKHRFYRTRSFNLDSGSRPCRVRNDRLFPRVSGSPCPRVGISLRYPRLRVRQPLIFSC